MRFAWWGKKQNKKKGQRLLAKQLRFSKLLQSRPADLRESWGGGGFQNGIMFEA